MTERTSDVSHYVQSEYRCVVEKNASLWAKAKIQETHIDNYKQQHAYGRAQKHP